MMEIDFIVGLSLTIREYEAVTTFLDRLSRQVHFLQSRVHSLQSHLTRKKWFHNTICRMHWYSIATHALFGRSGGIKLSYTRSNWKCFHPGTLRRKARSRLWIQCWKFSYAAIVTRSRTLGSYFPPPLNLPIIVRIQRTLVVVRLR